MIAISAGAIAAQAAPGDTVDIPDPVLHACVNEALEDLGTGTELLPHPSVNADDLERIGRLVCRDAGVTDLTGLEGATNMHTFDGGFNKLTEITPLLKLEHLDELWVNSNPGLFAAGLPDLSGLIGTHFLGISDTQLADLTGIDAIPALTSVSMADNEVESLAPFANVETLQSLLFERNHVRDISPLRHLDDLSIVMGDENHITDMSGFTGTSLMMVQVFNQTWWLPPVRVGDDYPNPLRGMDGQIAKPNPASDALRSPDGVPLPEEKTSGALVPAEDGSSWSYTETGEHTVRWQNFTVPEENPFDYIYFGGKLLQTAYDLAAPADQTKEEGQNASFTGKMDFPGGNAHRGLGGQHRRRKNLDNGARTDRRDASLDRRHDRYGREPLPAALHCSGPRRAGLR